MDNEPSELRFFLGACCIYTIVLSVLVLKNKLGDEFK